MNVEQAYESMPPLTKLIVIGLVLVFVSSPFAGILVGRRFALHLTLHASALGFIYFATKHMTLYACILCVPIIIIGMILLTEHANDRDVHRDELPKL